MLELISEKLKHIYLIKTKNFSIYLRGSYCFLEVDCKKDTYQFLTKNGIYNHFKNS
jgi:hypothetical protein